ncbi:hypothetical protein GWK47_051255 [Chionoecetes opilio]|uniref:Uncharacterized protein n=1 Tax=Chionoecetes opilio TaxID=41210 RepID=A0A8J5CQS8_CHIOP|nr:hypothetical protein GWK47_051255 [Chionoecetes opilio]
MTGDGLLTRSGTHIHFAGDGVVTGTRRAQPLPAPGTTLEAAESLIQHAALECASEAQAEDTGRACPVGPTASQGNNTAIGGSKYLGRSNNDCREEERSHPPGAAKLPGAVAFMDRLA